jgi:hypothetical protein
MDAIASKSLSSRSNGILLLLDERDFGNEAINRTADGHTAFSRRHENFCGVYMCNNEINQIAKKLRSQIRLFI